MEENKELLKEAEPFDPYAPVIPDAPDPDDTPYDDGSAPINWKERAYDRIPQDKVPGVIRFLDLLIPALIGAIVLCILLGMR